MLWADLLFALIVALIFTAVFAGGLRRPGPWAGWWWFFVIVLLAGMIAALWVEPIGPPLWGVATWLPILWLALLFALLLAAASQPPPPVQRRPPAVEGEEAATAATVVIGAFFWLLLFGMIVAVTVGTLI